MFGPAVNGDLRFRSTPPPLEYRIYIHSMHVCIICMFILFAATSNRFYHFFNVCVRSISTVLFVSLRVQFCYQTRTLVTAELLSEFIRNFRKKLIYLIA